MKIEFHIDQINEMMKYLDEVPHKYARGLIEYIQAHVKTQLPVAEKQQSDVAEIQQSEDDKIEVTLVNQDVA
jgi:hypothetical protein